MKITFKAHNKSKYGKLTAQGIHIKEPTYQEFLDAVITATRDFFVTIHMYATNKIFQRYLSLMGNTWNESDIVAFRATSPHGMKKSSLTEDQMSILHWIFNYVGTHSLTESQQTKGKQWLINRYFKKNGEERNDKNKNEITWSEKQLIKRISSFDFVGLFDNNNGYPSFCTPIYRANTPSGDSLDYTVTPELKVLIL